MELQSAQVSAANLAASTRPETASHADWWQDVGTSVSATQNIEDIENVWEKLEATGIESPGQSLDFTRAWIEKFSIPREQQLYVTGECQGQVVALLPLWRREKRGVRMLTWFPGAHVGCNAPLIDHGAFAQMSSKEQSTVWHRMERGLFGADLVRLHAIPDIGENNFFSALGESHPTDLLYRSEFNSWEECNAIQRSRSRRKHDKQQGAKLAAMGEVTFEELGMGDDAEDIIATMFAQKSRRFREWGIEDPFADPQVQQFYAGMFGRPGQLEARLHVVRLNGDVVSVRYNLVHGDRYFALISSMSDAEELAPGSPGKQNLLRAMQQVFDNGTKMVDMGAGYSDEKRHWCNVVIPLRNHMIPLTSKGRAAARALTVKARLQHTIKHDPRLFNAVKSARSLAGKYLSRS